KRNWRVAAFGTLSRAVEDTWSDLDLETEAVFETTLTYLKNFWTELVKALPGLGKLDLEKRKAVRETTLVDSANTIYALIYLAREMKDRGLPVSTLQGFDAGVLSRSNPAWVELGVLVPGEKVGKDGARTLALRNSRQARNALIDVLLKQVGLERM